MKRRLLISGTLIIISALLWFFTINYPNVYLQRAYYTAIALTISYLLFKFIFEELVLQRIAEPKTRYSFRKVVSIIYMLTFVAIAITIWVEHPQALLVSYGVLAAGAAFALQDILKNAAGGISIFLTGIYQVGDRIEVAAKTGDVIDIGILYTTLLETNEWVQGDQSTGRLTTIPNGLVFSSMVNNYTKDHPYIWDELSIPVTYDSDWKEAITMIEAIVAKETEEVINNAEKSVSKLEDKYYLPPKAIEPSIFLTLTDNWINISVRYVTEVRQRRLIRNNLNEKLLEELSKSEAVKIASESLDISVREFPASYNEENNHP